MDMTTKYQNTLTYLKDLHFDCFVCITELRFAKKQLYIFINRFKWVKKIYIFLWFLIIFLSLSQCKKDEDSGGIPNTPDASNELTCSQCWNFGNIIEIQGNTMVISEERSVILYELKNAGWQLMQTINYDRTSTVQKIILQPSQLIVGLTEGFGKVVIYTKQTNGLWLKSQELSKKLHQDNFGNAIHINGDIMIIGANAPWTDEDAPCPLCYKNDDIGRAYIYKFENNIWVYQTELVSSDSSKGDRFGESVYLVDNFAIVSNRKFNDKGVQVFENVNENWRFDRYLSVKGGVIAGYNNEVLINGYVDNGSGIKAYTVSNGTFIDKSVQDNTSVSGFSDHGEEMDVYKEYALIASEYPPEKCFLYHLIGNNWVIEQEFNAPEKKEAAFSGLAISDDYFVMGGRNFVKIYQR
jgi:hypothetical protein